MAWTQNAQFWRVIPGTSLSIFLAGVFCLFGSFSLIVSGMSFTARTLPQLLLTVFVWGALAVGWAFCGTRRVIKGYLVLVPLQIFAVLLLNRLYKGAPTLLSDPAAFRQKLAVTGTGALILIILGYVCLLIFFSREGNRFFRVHAEIELAGEIHRSLVPEISSRIGGFEFYGVSLPSGVIGGDLLDIVEHAGGWLAYVADVSGHGVSASVLMSMIKSAVRMQLSSPDHSGDLLRDLNRVLKPLIPSNAFVTFACLHWERDLVLKYSLAGHLPILHYRKAHRDVVEHSVSNVPLGILEDPPFESATITYAPGDLLAIVTDGFTETFNAQEQELGLEPLKARLLTIADKPLKEVLMEIRSQTIAFGKQTDDQTLLLIRPLE